MSFLLTRWSAWDTVSVFAPHCLVLLLLSQCLISRGYSISAEGRKKKEGRKENMSREREGKVKIQLVLKKYNEETFFFLIIETNSCDITFPFSLAISRRNSWNLGEKRKILPFHLLRFFNNFSD